MKETPLKNLRSLLETIFGKEHVNRYTTDILPTVLLVKRGVYSQDMKQLKRHGWVIAGIHPEFHKPTNQTYLQVGLRETYENE